MTIETTLGALVQAAPGLRFSAPTRELARIHPDGAITYTDGVTPEDVIRLLAGRTTTIPAAWSPTLVHPDGRSARKDPS